MSDPRGLGIFRLDVLNLLLLVGIYIYIAIWELRKSRTHSIVPQIVGLPYNSRDPTRVPPISEAAIYMCVYTYIYIYIYCFGVYIYRFIYLYLFVFFMCNMYIYIYVCSYIYTSIISVFIFICIFILLFILILIFIYLSEGCFYKA